ncbi:SusC/RagA family TonB-linked outer membrane protein [Mucilaginibacter glaciei]|uniref:SusC/RagA family TonB-linked outer membrane protein n=1 Tax=Mucilaginibacter glaciei TaxID=2772109 RepID=A0A926NWI1_9SPHI|nr:SusC/RagA family TonB-linked outer membrane protein [Mucilaginibacter glaciei]MBD1395355.1 SusC/RagA family TonB-linked outer membrane protein [Mucilaginibacter glaciei]
MRNRILQKKLFLTTTGICIIALGAYAQTSIPGRLTSARDTTSPPKSDSVAQRINLPFNTVVTNGKTTAVTQAIYTESLVKQPVTNVLNALTGRLAGLYTQQNSGQPGLDAVSLTLRGRTPIILVDGIPRPLTTIDLEEIESVTVLKDAMSTALLGVRGANGAILITTRKGTPYKQVISFTAQTAFQQPIGMPKALNAFNYATLRNEAIDNEVRVNPSFNTGLRYSATDLQLFKDQTDPNGHPDVDWRKQILKSSAQLNRYSLNLSGGNNSVRYFAALEHLSQDGLFKTDNANTYNTNNYFSSYLIRSNVDLNLTPKLSGGIHLLGRIYNVNEPGATTASIYNSFLTTPNNAYPIINPNGSFGGTPQFVNNIQGQATASGYLQTYTRDILADFFVKRTLDELTPGLYVKGLVSYASNLNETINRSKPVVAFQRFVSGTGVESYGSALTVQANQLNSNTISTVNGIPNQGQGRQNYLEASVGYDRTFNQVNNVNAVILANSDNNVYGSNIGYNVAGFSGRGAYSYNEKYLAEVAFSYNGSNYYPGNSHYKYGFFPVFGLGWNIAKEGFLKNSKWINSLKLAANYGKTGNDNPGYFAYIQRIFDGPSAYFGTAAAANQTLIESTLANPNITFEKADKLDISLQGTVIGKLGFVIDYYNNKFTDVLTQRGRNTTLLGNTYPNENIGRYRYNGFDFQLSWRQPSAGGFGYFIAANAGLQQSKVLYIDEPNQLYPYLQRTGQKVGQAFGYQAAGLFQSQADINAAAQNGVATVAGYIPQPGDIKYKDLNGDNIINQFDQAPIGPTGPLITYGADLGFNYKFFDFSALIQGVANYSVYLNGNSYWEFQNNGFGQAYEQQLGRYTPATAATATYPRLSIGTNVNNQVFSSYWYRNANYIRLKTVQAGFTLPARYANAVKLKSLRIFITGINLLTITKLKDRDPEVYNGAYPIQKLVNLGINVKL